MYNVAFTPKHKGLVSGSLDKTLKFWDGSVPNGKRKAVGSGCLLLFQCHLCRTFNAAVDRRARTEAWRDYRGLATTARRCIWVLAVFLVNFAAVL